MSDEYYESGGTLSVLVIGMILIGIVTVTVSLYMLKFETDLLSFDTVTYDWIVIIFSIALIITGIFAFKNDLIPEALLLFIVGFNNLAFAIAEYLSGDPTTLGGFDLILFIVLMCAAIMIWIGGDYLLAVISAILAISYLGFFIGSSAGTWITIVTGIVTFAMTMFCAMNYWRIMIDIDDAQYDED